MKEENIFLKQIKDHIITRVNGRKYMKVPDYTFFYDSRHKSKYNYINVKQHTLFLLIFSKFPLSRFFILSTSNNLYSISFCICLSFKSRHLELFCKINIQLSSTGIFLGLWSALQLYRIIIFLARLWMAAFNYLINKCDQKITQGTSNLEASTAKIWIR